MDSGVSCKEGALAPSNVSGKIYDDLATRNDADAPAPHKGPSASMESKTDELDPNTHELKRPDSRSPSPSKDSSTGSDATTSADESNCLASQLQSTELGGITSLAYTPSNAIYSLRHLWNTMFTYTAPTYAHDYQQHFVL
jgi:hypothetical protein